MGGAAPVRPRRSPRRCGRSFTPCPTVISIGTRPGVCLCVCLGVGRAAATLVPEGWRPGGGRAQSQPRLSSDNQPLAPLWRRLPCPCERCLCFHPAPPCPAPSSPLQERVRQGGPLLPAPPGAGHAVVGAVPLWRAAADGVAPARRGAQGMHEAHPLRGQCACVRLPMGCAALAQCCCSSSSAELQISCSLAVDNQLIVSTPLPPCPPPDPTLPPAPSHTHRTHPTHRTLHRTRTRGTSTSAL